MGGLMDSRTEFDTFEQGDPYERYVGRWSRRVAPRFLAWLGIPAGRRWLDVGCGTGALCAAILEHGAPASVTGVDPSEGFLKTAAQNLAGRAVLRQGSAVSIPLHDASVDVVVSGLVLNFVPDAQAALAEMARVTAKDGMIAAYVWDYADKMEMMRYFWDAAAEVDPRGTELDEGSRFPLCRPEGLQAVFAGAGLAGVAVSPIDIPTPFTNFDDYWQPFLGGQGSAPAYCVSLDEAVRARLRDRLRDRIPTAADGSISMVARVWAARGTVTIM
jgi:SAM-dependent methyltransferase